MNICWYGNHKKNYNRNMILEKAFSVLGHHTIQLRLENERNLVKGLSYNINKCDLMFVSFPSYRSVLYAQLLKKIKKKNIPLLYDPLVSRYNTFVEDRKDRKTRIMQMRQYYSDKLIYFLSDKISLDTHTHGKYFIKKFSLSPNKIYRVRIGVNKELFTPIEGIADKEEIEVRFHAIYNPLQGVETIIRAIKIIKYSRTKRIHFTMIGVGKYFEILKRSTYLNKFKDILELNTQKIPYIELAKFIRNADIYLGIFGGTQKADMVLPNKFLEATACAIPIITQRSSALEEFNVENEKEAYLVPPKDPKKLAEAIISLQENINIRRKIHKGEIRAVKKKYSIKIVAKELKKFIEE